MTHPTPAQWQRRIDQARRAINELEDQGPPLLDRDRHTAQADGWPAGGSSNGGRSADPTSTTEAAALAPERRDQIHDCAGAMVRTFDQALHQLNLATGAINLALHLASTDGRHSNPPTPCRACGRTVMCTQADPMRSGYCNACRLAWRRWKTKAEAEGVEPDRARFERDRKQEAAA